MKKRILAIIIAALALIMNVTAISFADEAAAESEPSNEADVESEYTDEAAEATTPEVNKDSSIGIRYISFGTGDKTMVIIPGLSMQHVTDSAQAIAESFAGFGTEYTVYLFDIRDEVPEDYSIAQMGEDLVTIIKELGLSDLYIYSASLGGMQAVYIAAHYPDLVNRLVIASSTCASNDAINNAAGGWIELAEAGDKQQLLDNMAQLIYSPAVYEAYKDVLTAGADAITDEVLARFINTAHVLLNIDLDEEASAITCKTFVVGSEGDEVIGIDGIKHLADTIKDCSSFIYGDEYGHAVYDEAADFKQLMADFFEIDIN